MHKIQMVDLIAQHAQIAAEVDRSIKSVLAQGAFINGPDVKAFANELGAWLEGAQVVPCANGTDALQVALMTLGFEPGDEVILPAFTFIATAEVVSLLGLTPVFVDVDPHTYNMDIPSVEAAVTNRTRAIIPVHLFGQCVKMHKLTPLARKHNITLIEDAAQAIGAKCLDEKGEMVFAGKHGAIGCTSFFPSKNLGCFGDGGALITTNQRHFETIKVIVNHGSHKKYFHERVGVNSRLDTLQAAILRVKLNKLRQYNQARQKAAAYYDQALQDIPEIEIPFRIASSEHVFHQYTLKTAHREMRDSLKEHLAAADIPSMVYYPVPLHLQDAYAHLGHSKGAFPVAEDLAERVLSLPMHTELSEEQLEYITRNIKSFFE